MDIQSRKNDLGVSEEALNETRRCPAARGSCLLSLRQGVPTGWLADYPLQAGHFCMPVLQLELESSGFLDVDRI
jgi:hypothetical protein